MIYTAHCPACDTYIEYIRKMVDRNNTPICSVTPECGPTNKILDATMVTAMKIATGEVYDSESGKYYAGREIDKHYKETGSCSAAEGAQEARIQSDRKNKEHRRSMREAITKAVYKY